MFWNGSESEVQHRGSTWNMANIKRTNEGTYRCTAYNGAGNADSSVANINVTCKNNFSVCTLFSQHRLYYFIGFLTDLLFLGKY